MTVARLALPFELPAPRERAELILSQLDKLPTLPSVAARLLSLTASDESSAKDVTRVIESDASLTAGLLRLAQRADKGVRSDGLTVAKVVTLLGFRAVRNAVLSLKLHETLTTTEETPNMNSLRRELWKHSLAVACTAELIAQKTKGNRLSGDAFVCGLLHDIGKIALGACLPKSYTRAAERAERQRICICDVERELFGLDHTTAGKRLASRWKLPDSIMECAWLHHHPMDALPSTLAHGDLVRIIHVADRMVRGQRIGFSGFVDQADASELTILGLDQATLEGIMAEIPQRMEPYCDLVGLDDMTSAKLCAESLAKANQELSRLNSDMQTANARLEVRSICFEILDRFTQGLSQENTPADVCAAAARSFCEALVCEQAIAYVVDREASLLHVGSASAHGERVSSSVIGLEQVGTLPRDSSHSDFVGNVTAERADRETQNLWRTLQGANSEERLWTLDVTQQSMKSGAVVFAREKEPDPLLRDAARECQALSHAIGLAVSHAQMRDRSERMTEELVEAHRRLRHAQTALVRTRSVSMVREMAGGAAHEINNPLAVISTRAQMLRQDCKDPDVAKSLSAIVEQAHKASNIASELMEFARPEPPKPAHHFISDIVSQAAERCVASKNLRPDQIKVCLVDDNAKVFADENQLGAILDAILTNAAKAVSPEKGMVEINSPSLTSDDTARIVVSDNGVGMTPNVLEHAIDPFFSSRPAGRGRGLGLSRAYRYTEINGGRLLLDSTPNVGTTVIVELPAQPTDQVATS